MNVTQYQEYATGYYLMKCMPDNVIEDWNRYLCTDGNDCKEVDAGHVPEANEMVFSCSIHGGRANVTLLKNGAAVNP